MDSFDYAVVTPEYYAKAKDFFKAKNKPFEYKCKGFLGRNRIYDFISCTEEEKALLQGLQTQSPGEDLSYLLKIGGFEELRRQIEGEDGFYLESIDWDPVHTFEFSLIRYSKYSFKPKGEREKRFICLEDEDYLCILTRRLMRQDFSFTLLYEEHPDIAEKILSQINSPYEFGGGMIEPYVIFMDEVESDAEGILGAPVFSTALYNDPSGESDGVFLSIDKEILKLSKFNNDSYPLSTIDLAGIPGEVFKKIYGVADNEDLLINLFNQFSGENAFERMREFMEGNAIPYTVNENGSLLK